MTQASIIEAIVGAGCSVRLLADGKASITGPVPDNVLAAIRADRDAFLEAWKAYEADRYLKHPPSVLPLRPQPTVWDAPTYKLVESYVRHQPDTVVQWTVFRASDYLEKRNWSDQQCTATALDDLLRWQMHRHPDPVLSLKTFDEVARIR